MGSSAFPGFSERSADEAATLYDRDFYAWTQEQARLLRQSQPPEIDWENAAEEIESLGRSDKRAIDSNLAVVLLHLLKLQFHSSAEDRRGWRSSVREHRRRLQSLLTESPSLRSRPASVLAEEYLLARAKAADETGLDPDSFPERCPYTIAEVLDDAFWPKPE